MHAVELVDRKPDACPHIGRDGSASRQVKIAIEQNDARPERCSILGSTNDGIAGWAEDEWPGRISRLWHEFVLKVTQGAAHLDLRVRAEVHCKVCAEPRGPVISDTGAYSEKRLEVVVEPCRRGASGGRRVGIAINDPPLRDARIAAQAEPGVGAEVPSGRIIRNGRGHGHRDWRPAVALFA